MKLKNVALNVKDLFTGRRVFIAQPGSLVVPVQVVTKKVKHKKIKYYNHTPAGTDKTNCIAYIGDCTTDQLKVALPEGDLVYNSFDVYNDNVITFKNITTGDTFDMQVNGMDKSESEFRLFAKEKQANVWAARPSMGLERLEITAREE